MNKEQIQGMINTFLELYNAKMTIEEIDRATSIVEVLFKSRSKIKYCIHKAKKNSLIINFHYGYYSRDHGTRMTVEQNNNSLLKSDSFKINNHEPIIIKDIDKINRIITFINKYGSANFCQLLGHNLSSSQITKKISELSKSDLLKMFNSYDIIRLSGSNNFRDFSSKFDKLGIKYDKKEIIEAAESISAFPFNFGRIASVFEIENVRVGVGVYVNSSFNHTKTVEDQLRSGGIGIKIFSIKEEFSAYNYIDAGRFFYITTTASNIPIFFDECTINKDNSDRISLSSDYFCKHINLRNDEEFTDSSINLDSTNTGFILDEQTLNYMLNITGSNIDTDVLNKKIKSVKEQKISSMKDKLTTKVSLKLEGMKFYSDRFEYEDITIIPPKNTMDQLNNQVISHYNYNYYWGSHGFNANGVIQTMFRFMINSFNRSHKIPFKVNNMDMCLIRKPTGKTNLWCINNIRINKSEMQAILENSTCYTDINEYNKLLKEVSSCSLRVRKYLCSGIDVKLSDEPITGNICRVNFIRIGNRNYFQYNGSNFQIRNTDEFIQLGRYSITKYNLIARLITYFNLDYKFAIGVVDSGIKEYSITTKKSEEFLKETVKLVKAKRTKYNNMQGYFVQGNKRKYFIDERSLSVYNADDGKRFCIVENAIGSSSVHLDKLSGRMLTVFNDSAMEKEIYTL